MEPLCFRYWPSGRERESIRLFPKRGEVRADSVRLDRRVILIPKIVATASEERELLISVMTPYGRDDVQIAMVPSWSRREGVTSGPSKARRVKEAIDGLCSRALRATSAGKRGKPIN